MSPMFISMPGGWEWLIILVIALLLFGRRLPDVMRAMGRSLGEFKKGVQGIGDEVDRPSGGKAQPDDKEATEEGKKEEWKETKRE